MKALGYRLKNSSVEGESMTTRHRRTPEERAADVFRPTLRRLEAKAAKSKTQWDRDEAAAEAMRQKIARLYQVPLTVQDLTSVAGRNLSVGMEVREVAPGLFVFPADILEYSPGVPQGDGTRKTLAEKAVLAGLERIGTEYIESLEPAQDTPQGDAGPYWGLSGGTG